MLQRILILMTYTIPYFEKKPAAPGISIGRLIATSTESKIVPIIIKTTYAEQSYSLSVELDNSTVIAGGELKAKIILKIQIIILSIERKNRYMLIEILFPNTLEFLKMHFQENMRL